MSWCSQDNPYPHLAALLAELAHDSGLSLVGGTWAEKQAAMPDVDLAELERQAALLPHELPRTVLAALPAARRERAAEIWSAFGPAGFAAAEETVARAVTEYYALYELSDWLDACYQGDYAPLFFEE